MLFMETIAVYFENFENHTKGKYTVCGRNADFMILNLTAETVITWTYAQKHR